MSKLVALELENFMSIRQARLEFDESGILNIVGYNDSGKSAITRALEVLLYDAYTIDQLHFIHDDKEYFGIGVEFDDGVDINKYKYASGPSIWEMYKDGNLVYTNKLSDGIASLTGIPEPIKNYFGVIQDEFTGEELNVRRNTDKLFLINTTGGDNYKIINSILRADILAAAVSRMNSDRNQLQSDIVSKSTMSTTLKGELKDLVVLRDEDIQSFQQGIQNLRESKQRLEYLMSIDCKNRELLDIQIYDELVPADTSRLRDLENIQGLRNALDIDVYPEVPVVDVERLRLLSAIVEYRQGLNVVIPEETAVVNLEQYRDIRRIGELFNEYWQIQNQLKSTEQEYQKAHDELHQLSVEYGYKVCNNCGAIVS